MESPFLHVRQWRFCRRSPATSSRPRLRAAALLHGFARASINTGHDATSEPRAQLYDKRTGTERIDYAFRAVHLTAIEGKRIAAASYGRFPATPNGDGCCTGGRQRLISAQRFPGDLEGIVAGATVLAFVDALTQSLWIGPVLADTPVPLEKLRLVGDCLTARRQPPRSAGLPLPWRKTAHVFWLGLHGPATADGHRLL